MSYTELLKELKKMDKISIKQINKINKDDIVNKSSNVREYKRFNVKTYKLWITGDSKQILYNTMKHHHKTGLWKDLLFKIVDKPKYVKLSAKYLVYVRPKNNN